MDVLDDIVTGLELRSSLYFRAELSAPFGVLVPEERCRIRFHVAGPGRSWVGLPSGDATFFEEGDLVLVPHGATHVVASAPGEPATPLETVLREHPLRDGVLRAGGGGARASLVCGHFAFDEAVQHPLVASLPPLLHLDARAHAGFAWMPGLLEAAEREARSDGPAARAVARRLSEILFLQVLRAALAVEGPAVGFLGLVHDPEFGHVLRSVHADPGADWSLDALASLAGASRSAFACRFRARTGMTPMRYLAGWRMQKARRLLADSSLSVSEVGRRVGYASEAAFNRAFRDVVGAPPGRYRRGLHRGAA